MTAVTDVIIFFVGLTVWSEQLPNDCGVKAILPRVVHTSPTNAATPDPPHVQDHVAAIVFPADSFVSQDGWEEPRIMESGTPASTPPSNVFKYVVLDSDSVRFITNGVTNAPGSLSGVTLPRLREQLCPARQTLHADYQAPYGGAAAVVFLPQGTLRTCLSVPADADGRLDTRVKLQTTGNLVISASTMRERKKELRLKPRPASGRIEVMIANVPKPYYQGETTATQRSAIDGMPHVNAYYAMSEPSNVSCTLSLRDWWNQLQYPDGIFLCDADTFASAPLAPIISASISTSAANFECSNTQWP